MSAFDIAGAVVWTPLAVLFWAYLLAPRGAGGALDNGDEGFYFILSIIVTLASAFCIARMSGATL